LIIDSYKFLHAFLCIRRDSKNISRKAQSTATRRSFVTLCLNGSGNVSGGGECHAFRKEAAKTSYFHLAFSSFHPHGLTIDE